MKETRFFFTPDIASSSLLPDEEASHALRVLRLKEGDEIMLMDGIGSFYRAHVALATGHHCQLEVDEALPQQRQWSGHLHIALAPTKNMDRTEWFVEKATEIGFDELSFLSTRWSERTVLKTERIEKIIISAMKQSHKAYKPAVNGMMDFKKFIERDFKGGRFIAHCHDENLPELRSIMPRDMDVTVLIGPEGDFSPEEVELAQKNGFQGVSLGKSRLRTETAALVAVHLMNLANS